MLVFDDIPSDLEEMIEEGEHILGSYSNKFENAMIKNELMDYGCSRRSHRIMTDKSIKLGYWGCIELLTGKTEKEHRELWAKEREMKEREMKERENLKILAAKFGYDLIKK